MVPSNQIYLIITFSEIENVWKFKQTFSFQSGLPTVRKVGFGFHHRLAFAVTCFTAILNFLL